MGFLSRLFGGKKAELVDRVWMNGAAKMADLVEQTKGCAAAGRYPLTIYHFEETGEGVRAEFERRGISCGMVQFFDTVRGSGLDHWRSLGDTLLIKADNLPDPAGGGRRKPSGEGSISVHLAELYPLKSRDEPVLHLAEVLPGTLEFTGFVALDEPWLQSFGVDRIKKLLEQMDVDEGEMLSHSMISRSLDNAREKIEAKLQVESKANSCAEWMRLNYGDSD